MKRLLIFLLCFCQCNVWAVIALVQNKVASASSCIITTTSATAGNLMAVFCEAQSGTFAASVTDNATGGSNTYTEVVGSRGGITAAASSIFYSQMAHSGATSVTCAGSCFGATAYEYSGALASGNPVDISTGSVNKTATTGGIAAGAAFTTTNAGDAIFAGVVPNATVTSVLTPYGHFVTDTNGHGNADYIPGTTVTGSSATWQDSAGSDSYGTSAVAFLPAAGGATVSGENKFQKLDRLEQ